MQRLDDEELGMRPIPLCLSAFYRPLSPARLESEEGHKNNLRSIYHALLPRDARTASAVLLSLIVRPSVRLSVDVP